MEEAQQDTDNLIGQLSFKQYAAKVWINTFSSMASFIGSCVVIHLARSHQKRSRRRGEPFMYHRILLMLSVADLFASVSTAMFPFVKIREEGWPWTIGNEASCKVGGMALLVFPELAQFLNLYLAIYFFMSIFFGWPDDRFQQKVELPFLFIFGSSAVTTAALALAWNLIQPNPINRTCYLGLPEECSSDEVGAEDTGQTCSARTETRLTLLSMLTVLESFGVALLSFALTLSVFLRVRRQYRRVQRLVLNPASISERQRQAVYQLVWFSIVYLNSVCWAAIALGWIMIRPEYVETEQGDPPLYFTLLMGNLFLPLQGFLNCIIYLRPMVAQRRKQLSSSGLREPWYRSVHFILKNQSRDQNDGKPTSDQCKVKIVTRPADASSQHHVKDTPDTRDLTENTESTFCMTESSTFSHFNIEDEVPGANGNTKTPKTQPRQIPSSKLKSINEEDTNNKDQKEAEDDDDDDVSLDLGDLERDCDRSKVQDASFFLSQSHMGLPPFEENF